MFIMFLLYSSSIFDIVMIDNEFMYKIAKHLIQYSSELSGRHYVSMVLRYCLPTDAIYMHYTTTLQQRLTSVVKDKN
jgi:hypothetical protein